MAKQERVLVDWAKPIEHVASDMEVRYHGTLSGAPDEFKHAIVCWKKGKTESKTKQSWYVDDYGCVEAEAPVHRIQRVRNVVARVEAAAPSTAPDLAGPVAELTAALELFGEEAPKLRTVFASAVSALIKVAETAASSATTMQYAVGEMRKLAAEQQTAYMEANLLLIEELRGKKSEPVQLDPPPALPEPESTELVPGYVVTAPVRIKPVVVKSPAELGKILNGTAEIKNFGHLECKELQQTVQTLALASGVRSIIVGGYEPAGGAGHRKGRLKYMGDITHGVKVKGYSSRGFAHEIFVHCDKVDRDNVIKVVKGLG